MAAKRRGAKDAGPAKQQQQPQPQPAEPDRELVVGELDRALREAMSDPTVETPWEKLEEAAASAQWPAHLLGLYQDRITADLPPRVLDTLSRRAIRFAADCFGESSPEMVALLRRVLAAAPEAEGAFRHLVVALSVAEQWNQLLDAYDAQLAVAKNAARRKELLNEAAGIAKDFARDYPRAVGYLDQLFALVPTDEQAASSLERLLERQERWEDLVRVWRQRLERLSGAQAAGLRQRIAVALHEKLGRADQALVEARALFADEREDPTLVALLERVLDDERVGAETRRGALDLLRQFHEAEGEAARIPALLEIAIRFSEGPALCALRRECGERRHAQGDLGGALDQYVALAALVPEDLEVEDRLRQLAEAAGDPARLARGLAGAAAACTADRRRVELLMRAARVQDRQLGDRVQAAALFERALAEAAAEPAVRLEALRRLEELHGAMGDDRQRLHALERLAGAEPRPGEQRLVWARAAELAATLGDVDRAVAAWQARSAVDPADGEALAAQVRLLAGAERWPALIEVLRRRIQTDQPVHQIRADLIEIATVAGERQGDLAAAIDAWREVTTRFGEDRESVGALADLYTRAQRAAELAELLSRNALVDRARHAELLTRLGDALRGPLAQAEASIEWYRRALEVEPAHPGARAGLTALLSDRALAPDAAEPLAEAAEQTGSWPLVLELLPHRLAGSAAPARKVRLLEQAAAYAPSDEQRFEWLCQALPRTPADLARSREVLRLAAVTGGFARAAEALEEALAAAGEAPPPLLAQLHEERGRLLEERLGDAATARESYAAALALAPSRLDLRERLVRTAARVGRWAEAAAALVDARVAPAAREATLLPVYEKIAGDTDTHEAAAAALAQAVDQARDLEPAFRRDLHVRVCDYFLGHCGDAAAAEAALGRALALDPRHQPTLARIAEVQRRRPDARLVATLSALAREAPDDLDVAREAAAVALASTDDEALRLECLERLWAGAVRVLRLGGWTGGQGQPAEAAGYALGELVRLHVASGAPARLSRAVVLLQDGARLPVDEPLRRQWLQRAAELLESGLGDPRGAVRAWRALHEEGGGGDDRRPREALARLYEEQRRFAEAIALRVAEVEAAEDADERLALRLDLVRFAGLLEQGHDQPAVLRANLAERPGHEATLRKLTDVLTHRGRPAELADVLDEQARLLEDRGEAPASAAVWAQLARLTEQALADRGRAIAAWQHVAKLEPTGEALDALARLTMAAGEATAAAAWLDRRLAMTEGQARCEVTGRLARAYLAAGQRHRAIACLDRALGEFPRADELRAMLAELYQVAEAWELQARVLADGCEHIDDEPALLETARGAIELYGRVGLLGRAVPVLERVIRLRPEDESFRSALADGLAQCGRHDEARALLQGLIDDAGWRRSRKRASLHHRLALVARAQGELPAALENLEQASSMDASNCDILQHLAEVAEAAGAPERAERAYRALLVLKRKETGTPAPADTSAAATAAAGSLAVTEVLLQLHDLAAKRGAAAEVAELLESALAAAITDDQQSRRLQRALLARQAYEPLARLFEKRLAHTAGSPAQADVYADVAQSLAAQGRDDEAFDAQLLAMEMDPERGERYQAAVTMARAQGKVDRLIERLLVTASRRRRRPEAPVASALLMRAAELTESDLGDLDLALERYRKAEEAHPASVEVMSGLGRIADRRGDDAERARMVGLLKQRAQETGASAEATADALFRAAALELGRPETREAGIASVCQALENSRDLDRARALVGAAGLPPEDLVKILPLYERVARQSGDERMLLDYLQRRAASPEATAVEVREAVDLAVALGRADDIEPLLLRLADLATGHPEQAGDVTWALLELVHRKKAAGDFEGAARALERAAEKVEGEQVMALARDLGERAARAGNLRLGATLLERLRARAPGDETLWQPLLAHYVKLGDREALDRLVAETLPLLERVAQRNELRLSRARFLLARDERDQAAVEPLRDVLLEEPGQREAFALLAGYYERAGAEGELIDLLEEGFGAAAAGGDRERVVELALRLGDVLDSSDAERARRVYERALEVAPGRRELLRRLLARTAPSELTPERAALMEELLAPDAGADVVRMARELAGVWASLGDARAVRRVLEKGCALAPDDTVLAEELERCYREQQAWGPLAERLVERSEREEDGRAAADLLCEAAGLRRERLDDAAGAVSLLRRARQRAPEEMAVLHQLAAALVAAGDAAAAVAEVRSALGRPADGGGGGGQRLPLRLLEAQLLEATGDRRAQVAALEQAEATWPDEVREPLTDALAAWRREALEADDGPALREATLRTAAFAHRRGDTDQANRLVDGLLAVDNADLEATRLAAILADAAEDPEVALAWARRLASLEQGEAMVPAAERLADLAEKVGRPEEATPDLEAALAANPQDTRLTGRLAQLYERAGDDHKLAMLLFDQANASEDDDRRFQLLSRAGGLFVKVGQGSVAMMALNEAVAIRPGDRDATLLLADAYTLAGALDEASELLKPLLAAQKNRPSPALASIYVRLARIGARAGDTRAELDALGRALELDKKNGALAAELADRAEAAGDDDVALKALRVITLYNSPGPISAAAAFLRQARIAHRRGDNDRAILFARRAAQEAGDKDPIQVESREFLTIVGDG
jgi:tetratricopeptide (TPR) repeat protein